MLNFWKRNSFEAINWLNDFECIYSFEDEI